MKDKIPNRWTPFTCVGKPISGTPFIAFKVPLNEWLCNSLPQEERFSPAMLMEMEPRLSMIIDLTNTTRYYNKEVFMRNGIHYEKITCPGRLIPDAKHVQYFFKVVDNFVKFRLPKNGLIGVHCTHGVNRTGYFICKYMIKKLGIEPAIAIASFQEGRGHKIERVNYVNDLHNTRAVEKKMFVGSETNIVETRPKPSMVSRYSMERGSQLNYYDDDSFSSMPYQSRYGYNTRQSEYGIKSRGRYQPRNNASERSKVGEGRRDGVSRRSQDPHKTNTATWLDISNKRWSKSEPRDRNEKSNSHARDRYKYQNANLRGNRGRSNLRGGSRNQYGNDFSNGPSTSQNTGKY